MPVALRRSPALQARVASPHYLPAPYGGWNARDAWTVMQEHDAILLDNWFPESGNVRVRGGYAEHATGVGSGAVETLMAYRSGTTVKLLAASSNNIFDVTAAGAGTALTGGGFSNGRWQYVNMDGKLGMVNGQNTPQTYNGSAISGMTIAEIPTPNLTVASLVGIHAHKSRSYFWANTADFYYSDIDTLGGDVTKFPLSRVTHKGGRLVAMATWTRDGGTGMDDLAVFLMSSGEVIVYSGSDPGDPADWSLVGRFELGAPLGVRALDKVGGDIIVATQDGYQPLSNALPGGRSAQRANVSDKISLAVRDQIRSSGAEFGWQVLHYPRGRYLLVNVPTTDSTICYQHVVNLDEGSWCRFTGQNAKSWVVHEDELYFGAADGGVVYKADTGTDDDGTDIVATAHQAYSFLRGRGIRKNLSAVRMTFEARGTVPVQLAVDADFKTRTTFPDPVTFGTGSDGHPWGSPWGSPWGTGVRTRQGTLVRGGIGDAFSLRLRVAKSGDRVTWNGTHMISRPAGMI